MSVLQKIVATVIFAVFGLIGCSTMPSVSPEITTMIKGKEVYINPVIVYHEAKNPERVLQKEEINKEQEEGARMSMAALINELRRAGFDVVGTKCPECTLVSMDIWYYHNIGFAPHRASGVALRLTVTYKNSQKIVTFPRGYLYHELGWIYGWTEERIHNKAAAWAVNDMLSKLESIAPPIQGIVK